jgi:hypothetical protein
MTGTTTGIVIIVVVVVAALAIWLGLVARAARRPAGKNEGGQRMRGLVQGGEHVGGGRSVMPHRDAEVPEGGGTPPPPDETELARSARRTGHRSGNPMEL